MLYLIGLTLASIVVFFRRINTFPLRNWDEAWYAEAIKNMASGDHDYLVQFWNGRYYFDHAPLYFWLSAPIFKLFGGGEWQARLVSSVAAVIVVIFVCLIGKKLHSWLLGGLASLVLLTFGGVVIRFSHGNLDSLLICLFLVSFYLFLLSKNSLFGFVCGITIGLGMLVKSWGVGLFPLYWIVVYSIFVDKKIPRNFLTIALGIFFAVSWWYWLGIKQFGSEFINWFILNPSEGRLSSPFENFSLDYVKFSILDAGFWLIIFGFLAVAEIRKSLSKQKFILPFILVGTSYIFGLNFLSDKSGWYLIPAYPLIAIVIGFFCVKLIENFLRIGIFLVAVLFAFGWWNVLRIENVFPDRSAIGAELGILSSQIVPKEDEVILEDADFTSFLYYSDQTHIYTLQQSRREGEWWILKPDELKDFLTNNQKTWIVTRNYNNYKNLKKVDELNGYHFLKTY